MTHVVTYKDWESARTLEKAMQPGDYAADEIVAALRDALPPTWYDSSFFQLGEPYSHRRDPKTGILRATYSTFSRDETGWRYCGHCFPGQTKNVE